MSKLTALFLSFIIAASLVSCGNSTATESPESAAESLDEVSVEETETETEEVEFEAEETETEAEETESEGEETESEVEEENQEMDLNEALNMIEGGLSQYEMETLLAYGPTEWKGSLSDADRTTFLNSLVAGLDWDTSMPRIETGDYAGYTTVSLEDMNRYFSVFTDYRFTAENTDVIERGRYMAFYPATLNYTCDASITGAALENDNLVLSFDYSYLKYGDDGQIEDEQDQVAKKAVFNKQDDGLYVLSMIS